MCALPLEVLFPKCKRVQEEWVLFLSETHQQLLEKQTNVIRFDQSEGCNQPLNILLVIRNS